MSYNGCIRHWAADTKPPKNHINQNHRFCIKSVFSSATLLFSSYSDNNTKLNVQIGWSSPTYELSSLSDSSSRKFSAPSDLSTAGIQPSVYCMDLIQVPVAYMWFAMCVCVYFKRALCGQPLGKNIICIFKEVYTAILKKSRGIVCSQMFLNK